mgnify:CR=1 FL=1
MGIEQHLAFGEFVEKGVNVEVDGLGLESVVERKSVDVGGGLSRCDIKDCGCCRADQHRLNLYICLECDESGQDCLDV